MSDYLYPVAAILGASNASLGGSISYTVRSLDGTQRIAPTTTATEVGTATGTYSGGNVSFDTAWGNVEILWKLAGNLIGYETVPAAVGPMAADYAAGAFVIGSGQNYNNAGQTAAQPADVTYIHGQAMGAALAQLVTAYQNGAFAATVQGVVDPVDTTGGGNTGPGADSCTIHIAIAGVAVPDADVWTTSDSAGTLVVAGTLQTDSAGNVTFLLDAGNTYYLFMEKDGVNPIVGRSFVAVAD